MKRDSELSLGEGSEVRPSRRRAGWVLATLLEVSLALALACNPVQVTPTVEVSGAKKQPTPTPITRYDSNPIIEALQRGLVEAYELRPDCFITDVNIELDNLLAGNVTFEQRPLPGNLDPKVSDLISRSREAYKEGLRKSAIDIRRTLSSDRDRALSLAYLYDQLSVVNIGFADGFPKETEQEKELLRLGQCAAVKEVSLAAPYAIEDLKRSGSATPTIFTPLPLNRPRA